MTTICTIPYDKGIIVLSDTRATNTQTLQKFIAPDKTSPNLCSIFPDLEIYASGAGIAGIIEAVAHPAVAYFELNCLQLSIDPHSLSACNFLEVFSNLLYKSSREQITEITGLTQMDMEMFQHSALIITVKTRKFVCSFSLSYGGNCYRIVGDSRSTTVQTEEEQNETIRKNSMIQTGSGGRYILGALMMEHSKKPMYERSLKEVATWIYKNFANIISLDNASSTLQGYNMRVVSCDPNFSSKNYLLYPKLLD